MRKTSAKQDAGCKLHVPSFKDLRSEESGKKCAETGKYIGENDLLQNIIYEKNQTRAKVETQITLTRELKTAQRNINVLKFNCETRWCN